jgi:hypothetical protein
MPESWCAVSARSSTTIPGMALPMVDVLDRRERTKWKPGRIPRSDRHLGRQGIGCPSPPERSSGRPGLRNAEAITRPGARVGAEFGEQRFSSAARSPTEVVPSRVSGSSVNPVHSMAIWLTP